MPGLREFFRSEAFVPTVAVFPPIDTARLAGDLALAAEGRTRGGRGQPGPDETGLDGIESRIVESVGDLRRRGLDSYGENVRVYDARLARAVDAREAVEMAASKARSDFQAAVAVWQARMATPAANIELAKGAFARFRAEHGVGHVAVRADLLSWIFVALLVIALESAANAFLFRAVMSTGWAGGHDHRRGDLGFERGDRGARHLLRAQPQPPALVLEAVRAGGGADRHRPLPRLQPRGGASPRRAGAGAGARGGPDAVLGEPLADAAGARELPVGAADAGGRGGGDRRRPQDLPRDRPLSGVSGDLRHGDPRPRRLRGEPRPGDRRPRRQPRRRHRRPARRQPGDAALDPRGGGRALRAELAALGARPVPRALRRQGEHAPRRLPRRQPRGAAGRGSRGGRGGAGAFQRPLRLSRDAACRGRRRRRATTRSASRSG